MRPSVIGIVFAVIFFAGGGGIDVMSLQAEELSTEEQEIVENLDLLENIEMLPALEWLMQGDGDAATTPEESSESGSPEEPQDGEKP